MTTRPVLRAMLAEVAAAERERCARECEAEAELGGAALAKARLCAARIRGLPDRLP